MATVLNPYLNFRDNARTAMGFYKSVLGGELIMSTFGEGGMSQNEGDGNLIMHAQLNSPNGMVLMASDTPASMGAPRGNGAISLSGNDEAALRGYWDKLSEGANIIMPLMKAPWGDTFGMLTDKFDVQWLVNIAGAKE
jgi:PhnB protein